MDNSDSSRTSWLPLDCIKVPKFVIQKAEEELGETDAKREQCLKDFKEKIAMEKGLRCNLSDNFLLQFLRVRKMDTEKAFKLLKKFYKHRQRYHSLYGSYTPKQNEKVMKSNLMTFLPNRTADGCSIWAARWGLWDSETVDFEEILRFCLICTEKELQNPVTQICGMITILDLKEFSWSHLFHLPPSAVMCYMSALQDSFPIRHKAIHITNNPSIFSLLFAIIKPLLSAKIRDRIHFHGDNMDSLHQFLDPGLLPTELCGTLEPFQNKSFYESLLDREEYFEKSLNYGYLEDA